MTHFKLDLPAEVLQIIQVLNKNGHSAYVVGGCVRDCILGRAPGDWDITTSAKPGTVKTLFSKTVDTGIKHGTVSVILEGKRFEVTTYRIDGEYADNRRPERVEFTSSVVLDLSRRDFTVNAISYHPSEGLVDPFNGLMDIKNRIIKTVGNAGDRFKEDALRMLRAIRFSAQLNFTIESATYEAIKSNNHLIRNISFERIRDELTKILISGQPGKFALLKDTHLLEHIMPEFCACFATPQNNPYHIYNVAEHTLKSVANIKNEEVLRWTMLLHDIGKTTTRTTDEMGIDHFYGHEEESVRMSGKILRRLKFDRKSIEIILRLIRHHDRIIEPNEKAVRRAASAVGADIFEDLLKVKKADNEAQNPELCRDTLNNLERIKNIFQSIKEKKECLSIKDLEINGHDLIALGYRQGKEIGTVLNRLLQTVLDNPDMNIRDKLIQKAGEWLEKGFDGE
ncbi:MAG TPA: CCA tRNA nucleotidyltransferase [Clostridiaceae bacterium]|nr:CCA tRNA nucleotidyltransferase [Clostridiaceae bacterium]